MRPPIAWTIPFVMNNPSPVPFFVHPGLGNMANFANTRSASSGEIPIPSSLTDSLTNLCPCSSTGEAAIVMVVPTGE